MTRDEILKEFEKLHTPRNDLSEKEVLQHGALVVTAVNFAEHILRVAESKRWRPIESAPNEYCATILAYADNGVEICGRDFRSKKKGGGLAWFSLQRNEVVDYDVDGSPIFNSLEVLPTHWMPLPSAPEESK